MTGRVLRSAAVFTLASLASAGAAENESSAAYRIAARTSTTVLPTELRTFFEDHVDTLSQWAMGTDDPVSSKIKATIKREARFIKLDVAAGSADPASRRSAARRFPQDIRAAQRLFEQHGEHGGGTLPWALRDRYLATVRAFRGGDSGTILREAGMLVRLATDAALPFNTTFDRDGETGGNLHWPAGGSKSDEAVHQTVRHRCQIALINRLQGRFRYEVRVSPDRSRVVTDPLGEVFDVLLRAHDAIEALLRIDAEILLKLNVADRPSFMATYGSYYAELAEEASWIMEARLEDGALLAANLIMTAWAEVGKPSPDTFTTAPDAAQGHPSSPGSTETKPEQAGHDAEFFVASRDSKIYHRSTCYHAKRISAGNRITFKSRPEAEASGRKPCKSCLPESQGNGADEKADRP